MPGGDALAWRVANEKSALAGRQVSGGRPERSAAHVG